MVPAVLCDRHSESLNEEFELTSGAGCARMSGTGKSTTIWHIINSRVARDSRVLVTCTRNQAVDAVSQKVASLGVLVRKNVPCPECV